MRTHTIFPLASALQQSSSVPASSSLCLPVGLKGLAVGLFPALIHYKSDRSMLHAFLHLLEELPRVQSTETNPSKAALTVRSVCGQWSLAFTEPTEHLPQFSSRTGKQSCRLRIHHFASKYGLGGVTMNLHGRFHFGGRLHNLFNDSLVHERDSLGPDSQSLHVSFQTE